MDTQFDLPIHSSTQEHERKPYMLVMELINSETEQCDVAKIWAIFPIDVAPKILYLARIPTNNKNKLNLELEKSGKFSFWSNYRMIFESYTLARGKSSS